MEGDFIKINDWMLPLSCLYGWAVNLRNTLFDIGVLKSRSFDVPIISVGNITVGGTGKTPHVEYLVRLLHDKFKVAVLSRGYKRKSKGFVVANEETTVSEIGDEPFQMKEGKWIGAKLGFFNCRPNKINDGAFLDVDWIRFHK